MQINIADNILDTGWKDFTPSESPFLSYEFFLALEESHVVGNSSGWQPIYIEEPGNSLLYTFAKNHSYGEYIFDWDWANFYQQQGIQYYPKLTSMIPFTSATTPHFLSSTSDGVMAKYEEIYQKNNFSSSHFLFITESEREYFKSKDYLIRDSFQYHFYNKNYESFDGFLQDLKPKKAKQIRKERRFSEGITFNRFTGDKLSPRHAVEMFQFYHATIKKKNAIAYLNEDFFLMIFDKLRHNIVYVQASKNDEAIAGAFYFFSSSCLYGRYWGSTEDIKNLHFELCYYQGIEFCIENKINDFEAGAQGEHKIARGFRPVKTFSAHKMKIPVIHGAIENYISEERASINQLFPLLESKLPFR